MKIIFLNTWQGKMKLAIKGFLDKEFKNTDIFCFQEVSPNFFKEIVTFLPQHTGFYEAGRTLALDNQIYGQAIFIRKNFELEKSGRVKLYYQLKDDIGFLQYQLLDIGRKKLWLGNVHGKTKPGTKHNTKTRLKQSERIINFFKDKEGPKIFGGDFNLNPDTKSIKMFEEAGYRNLIRDFDIKNTRNKLSWDQFNNVQYFADYVFVSPEVIVKSFEVPYNEISDHLPLILNFEI